MIVLPSEIMQHILEFNPNHRDKLKLCFNSILVNATMKRIQYIYDIWKFNNLFNDQTLDTYFIKYIDDPEHMLKCLSQCTCCYRHTILRPSCLNCNNYIRYLRGDSPREKKNLQVCVGVGIIVDNYIMCFEKKLF